MNVSHKLMLIVVTSVVLVTAPSSVSIYYYAKYKLLATESVALVAETKILSASYLQKLNDASKNLNALARLHEKDFALPLEPGDEQAFDRKVHHDSDLAWRSATERFDGRVESGIFLPPNTLIDANQKKIHLRSKRLLDVFGSSMQSLFNNTWLITRNSSMIIYDSGVPDYVAKIPIDFDYAQTPWITLGDPSTNPKREMRWTQPLYDPIVKTWLVSAVMPLDANGQWIGTLGHDVYLNKMLPTLFQPSQRYPNEQHFLLDSEGNFIVAGPWQKALETNSENFKLNFQNEPSFAKLLKSKLTAQPQAFKHEVSLQGRQYLAIGMTIPTVNWHYFRLLPIDEILAPIFQLFYVLVTLVLVTGLLVGFLIDVAVKRNIVNRLQELANAMRQYGLGELNVRANLTGNDEIAKASQEFNTMASQLEATIDAIPDMLFDFGLDGTYYSAHIPTDDFLIIPKRELIGKKISEVLPPEQAEILMSALQEAHEKGLSQGRQYQRMTSEGLAWFELSVAKKASGDSQNPRFMAISRNITERKLAAEKIQHLAFYDTLTGLPNRRLLLDRLNHALATSSRRGRSGAVLFLDLDNFKTVNDTLGHKFGDQLLLEVGKRLSECLREGDTVARLGGDEYVVVLEDLSDQAIKTAAQVESIANKILSALNRPYMLASRDYHNTPSIGVTLFNGHDIEVEELFGQADIAMYQAKKAGGNTLRFFNPQMQESITRRAALEGELRVALEQQQFQLYYQIQVNHLGRALGAEALIRWEHPTRGLLPPLQFIPLAEETSLILHIGDWVLETACAQIKAWQRNKHTSRFVLSINVSAKQFHQEYFVEQVQAALLSNGINPALLKLELTESILLNDADSTIETMSALKEIGVQFSLDDFGTGFSSLQYLKRLPLNQLKIDQSFVRDIAVDSSDQAIVRTIIAMAQTLNLNVIAEGVETQEQQDLLLEIGCTHFQGYLFGKPAPIKELDKKLKR